MAFYDNINLDKGMYHSEKAFSAVLESLDPSANYKGSELDSLDAYERQLKRFDIKVKGFGSDNVAKFFQSTASATLFPEFVKRCVLAGAKDNSIINDIVASTTAINTLDYRPISAISSTADKSFDKVDVGKEIPSTEIKLQKNLIALQKRGRMLTSSYEIIKFQRLDLFAVTLKQIGAYIAKAQTADAVNILINGDGNGNPASKINAATAGKLAYDDLIKLWSQFTDFNMTTMLAAPDVMIKMLGIAEFKDPSTGLNFQGTGKLMTPMGAVLYSTSAVPAGTIIGLDKSCALEMVTAADIEIESDKLIDRQLERAAITSINGFAKIYTDASVIMNVGV